MYFCWAHISFCDAWCFIVLRVRCTNMHVNNMLTKTLYNYVLCKALLLLLQNVSNSCILKHKLLKANPHHCKKYCGRPRWFLKLTFHLKLNSWLHLVARDPIVINVLCHAKGKYGYNINLVGMVHLLWSPDLIRTLGTFYIKERFYNIIGVHFILLTCFVIFFSITLFTEMLWKLVF